MSQYDRDKWNTRYSRQDPIGIPIPKWLAERHELLPKSGTAIDVAGGPGGTALWLAQRGLTATLADISSVALRLAEQGAKSAGLELQTLEIDLEVEPFPAGPWDVVLMSNYLQRSLFGSIVESLNVGGLLLFSQPTRRNLERNEKPPLEFLLDNGELPRLIAPLSVEIIHYEEGWLDAARHEARLIARRR